LLRNSLHAPQVRFISKQKSTALAVLFCLSGVDKKDATLKTAKLLIYQGFSIFFEYFQNFFELGGWLAETKELTKKMRVISIA
jgi:hypothetical protein